MAAILLGHLLGGLMMFAAGMIGAKERKSAMETVKMSFGEKGSLLFAVLNVLQLVGWTAIMIYDGALAADGVLHIGNWVWALVIVSSLAVISITKSELKKISLNSTSDKIKSAAMATVFSLPRLVSPMKIHTIIRIPMTSAHTQFPICNTPSAASAPS